MFVFQSSKQPGDSVQIDDSGRVVLGGNKFLIVSKRLKKNKVRFGIGLRLGLGVEVRVRG